VYPGLVQKIAGPLEICSPRALHGTFEPHRWRGERVWLAGFVGDVQRQEDKLGSLHREIVGEIFPETALSHSVGARIGLKNLRGADLQRANLYGANLQSADLQSADLQSADLQRADLQSADLRNANLQSANLRNAYLQRANLQSEVRL
jgi:uncharacterized protein YjbI with pentapeptide repeats